MTLKLKSIFVLSLILLYACPVNADIVGKVVGVADGDTITVLQKKKQYRIRLYGIDTPEKRQAFGSKAKQYTSDMVFGKVVRVVEKDIDRYGRTVGMVYVGDRCVNEAILKNGYAWVYQRYCEGCENWNKIENKARLKKIGLWADKNPIPPWEYRRGKRTVAKKPENVSGVLHGNVKSRVLHSSSCSVYNCKNCTAIFTSRSEAIAKGFRPCKRCQP